MYVQYNSTKRPTHSDSAYGTGEWVAGQVKMVPEETGRLLLKHADVFTTMTEAVEGAQKAGVAVLAPVRCITRRALHIDGLYDTGSWVPLEVKKVKVDIANKMVRHADVFELVDEDEADGAQVVGDVKKDDTEQVLTETTLDFIRTAGAKELRQFIREQWDVKVNNNKSTDFLREHAEQLFNQYGRRP